MDMNLTLTPILGISGSLRRESFNSSALRALSGVAEEVGARLLVDDLVRALPPFDPDAEANLSLPVRRFRMRCAGAAGVLVAVPEYAFGIPGAFKNALDWTVQDGSLYQKPITLLNVAPEGRGKHVQDALALVFRALDADVAYRKVPIENADRDAAGEVTNPEIIDELRAVLGELVLRAAHRDSALPERRLSGRRHNG
jgi:NAD(P)H-dependent FMN reductase